MQELEKIIEEINDWISDYEEENDFGDFDQFIRGLKRARILIRAHMTEKLPCENDPETTRSSRHNDGWIPVEERLPTMEEYQKDDGRFILDDGNRRCAGYFNVYTGRFYSYQHITQYMAELHENNWVIAWSPLPEPYRPERSNDEKE